MNNENSWENLFKQKGKIFLEPDEGVVALIPLLKERNTEKILDFGSGSGRHIIYLTNKGFKMSGFDSSESGNILTKGWLKHENLQADITLGDMRKKLPYSNNYFDGIISIRVMHHSEKKYISQLIHEFERLLKKGGVLFITVPSLMNQGEKYKKLEERTYVPLDGEEKGLPHHFFTKSELRESFSNFDILDIHIDSIHHYCLTGVKK